MKPSDNSPEEHPGTAALSVAEAERDEARREAEELRGRLREAQGEIERLRAELRAVSNRPGVGERVARALGGSRAGSKDDPTGVGHG